MEKTEVLEFVKKMKSSDHVIMFYARPEDKYLVLSTYLKAALEKGGAAAYFFGQGSAVQIVTALKEFGVAVEKYMRKGALHLIDQSHQYFIDAETDRLQSLDAMKNLYTELASKGFKEIRIAEEMAFFLEYGMKEHLMKYEKTLNKTLELPVSIICAYDFDLLSRQEDGDLYLNLIRSHGTIIFAGPKEWVVKTY